MPGTLLSFTIPDSLSIRPGSRRSARSTRRSISATVWSITGSQFRGISDGSSGNSQDSPTDYPLVQLRSIESGQTSFLSDHELVHEFVHLFARVEFPARLRAGHGVRQRHPQHQQHRQHQRSDSDRDHPDRRPEHDQRLRSSSASRTASAPCSACWRPRMCRCHRATGRRSAASRKFRPASSSSPTRRRPTIRGVSTVCALHSSDRSPPQLRVGAVRRSVEPQARRCHQSVGFSGKAGGKKLDSIRSIG